MTNNELIAALEKATGADRAIDLEIARLQNAVVMRRNWDDTANEEYTHWHYTASIDAALTLVPEGWHLAALGFIHPDFRQATDREWRADIFGPVSWVEIDDFPEPQYGAAGGSAPTPALAICIAAMRARHGEGEGA